MQQGLQGSLSLAARGLRLKAPHPPLRWLPERTRTVALTVGVEEEFLVSDRRTGALSPRANEIVDASRQADNDEITTELNLCQIEAATPVCATLADVERELT